MADTRSIRELLADALTEVLPDWRVYAYRTVPTNPRKPVLIVRQGNVRPTPQAPRLARDTDFSIALLVPETDPAKVEGAVEDALDVLLDALDALPMPGLIFQEAQRATFDDKFQGYDVTLTITNAKE